MDNLYDGFIDIETSQEITNNIIDDMLGINKHKEIKIPTYKNKYNKQTLEYYKELRIKKIDPITHEILKEDNAFKFIWEWDAYTGERLNVDPYGPLYFDPNSLIYYFYTNRLKKLWVNGDTSYEGYYDDGVGAGENFKVIGRGEHPDWYLFRIPLIDIYLNEDHNNQLITFGPKLLYDEIIEIYNLAKKLNNYHIIYNHKLPNIIKIKEFYDSAISNDPIFLPLNRDYVEKLKNM